MIRILQVLPRLRRGGSQAMVMNLYRALNRQQYQFDFIIFTLDHDDYYDEIREMGGKIYHFTKLNATNLIKVRKEWNDFFTNHPEYKILHSHVRSFASFYLPIANKFGVTTIIHSHSTSNGTGVQSIIKSALEFPLRRQADFLFACSSEAGKWLFGEKAVYQDNYRFVPNAIDINKFRYSQTDRNRIRTEYDISEEPLVGHVGGFEKPKNHQFIVDCFRSFLRIHSNAKLLLVGDGTFEDLIRSKCEASGISDHVIFAGLQTNVEPYLSAMDVFLFPSLWEGLPVSVVEAQASGLKCLLSDSITRDVELSDLLTYYPLDAGIDNWAQKLAQLIVSPRGPASDDNIKQLLLFDSNKTIRDLEHFYSSCI